MKVFRRNIRLVGEAGLIRGEIEDDFHHFTVTLEHDGERVLAASGEGLRTPWNTCLLAPRALTALEGLPLQAYAADFVRQSDSRAQCTHMYELLALAASHALRNVGWVEYAATVPYPIGGTPAPVTLLRDGAALLEWQVARPGASAGPGADMTEGAVADAVIVVPAPFAGQRVQNMLRWAREALAPELFDAVYILRRATTLSVARVLDLDLIDADIVQQMFEWKTGDCFAFQPENKRTTVRQRGSTVDFTARPDALLGRAGD